MSGQIQARNVGTGITHAGLTFATCQLTLEFAPVFLHGGRNDNVSLLTTEDVGSIQPIGFAAFQSPNPGPNSMSGMVPNQIDNHGLFIFLFNQGPQDITLLEQDVNSRPECRFDFGGAGPQTLTVGKSSPLLWNPLTQRWTSFG
jgi:hypothetical protein